MEEWKEYKLEEICTKITDGSHFSPQACQTGYPMFSVKDMLEYGFDYSNCKHISAKDFESMKNGDCVPQKGDILVAKDGSFLKQIFECKETKEEAILSSIAIFRPNQNIITPTFLCYLLKSPKVYNYIALNCVSGSALPRIVLKDFKKVTMQVPPLPTQQKIAAILSSLDDKIELNNKINTNLEQQAQALFKNWFVDFEPFGGKMPEGWKVGKLSDISILSAGGDKPKEVSDKITEDYKVPIYSNGLDNFGLYGYTNKAKIFEESVTVSARGTIGFVCLRMVPYVPIVRLISLIPKTDFVSAKYLYLHLLNCNITGTGTTQQQLTVPAFSKEQIIIPSKNAIDSFTNTVNPFFETIVHNRKENEKLSSMRDTLLPKLMNGEIKVDEVRK